ncbi:multiple C2 and transmembrane domain-containing 2-like isoform X1, partial [Brachionus plicatilis]
MFNKSKKKPLALSVSENNANKTSSLNRKLSIKKNISRSFSSLVSGLRKSINIGKNNQPGNDELSAKNKNSNSLSDISSNLHLKKQSSHDRNSGSNTPNQSIKSYKRSLKNTLVFLFVANKSRYQTKFPIVEFNSVLLKGIRTDKLNLELVFGIFSTTKMIDDLSQLSSYYIKNLNDDDTNIDNGNKNNQDNLDLNIQNLPLESLNHDAIGTSNYTENLLSSKLQENEENKNQVKFFSDESDEKLDLIDDLPEFSVNIGDTIRKFIKQTSLSSETQASTVSTYLNATNSIPSYYELKIKLNEGKNLAIRDIGGSSDPYAKFVLNGVNVYKSKIIFKNLNPEWNEEFSIKLSPSTLFNKTKRSNSIQSVPQNSDPYLIDEPLESFLSKFKLKMFIYDYDRGFL